MLADHGRPQVEQAQRTAGSRWGLACPSVVCSQATRSELCIPTACSHVCPLSKQLPRASSAHQDSLLLLKSLPSPGPRLHQAELGPG